MKTFSVVEGIVVQTKHLQEWQKKLKPEVYEALQRYAVSKNDVAKDGYGVLRGTDLSNFIENYRS